MLFDTLPIATYRVSLRDPGAELEDQGGSQQPPPHQVVDNLEAHQGLG